MKEIKFLLFIITCILILDSCKKLEQLSAVPQIEFTSFTLFDTTDIYLGNHYKAGTLKFKFQDGDGDLGLDAPTQGEVDTTDLFISLFRKNQGVMDSVAGKDPLLPSPAFRIPYMERLGQNKLLKGSISVTFIYLSYVPTDTIKYDFYIKDRALNVSNIASTVEIVLSENKTFQ